MSKEVVSTDTAPEAIGPYSQAVRANGLVFASGQIALEPDTGEMVQGGIQAETERILENIKAVLSAAGSSLENVVQSTVYLADMADFPAMNEVYARYFPASPPARATVAVASLPRNARVEIAVTAVAD